MSEIYQFLRSYMHVTILLCYIASEATSITLSPLGMVSVCPEGQLLLTCERISGSVLFWDFSVPHMASITQRIVQNQGGLLSPEFKIGFTELNITRTSNSSLTSQLLINNVTTEINGSTIYCSEDGDENNAPMTAINVKYKDELLRSIYLSLNVTMVNQFLRSNDVTVTLQWPREPGAVYHVSVSPEVSHTELTSMEHRGNVFTMNLTISYDIQYNVSIESSLCGVTTTKVLKYVTCNYPPMQLLRHPIVVVSGSQDSPPIEGQFITYTCPTGFILTGPNMSVCMGNREWEPEPGEVDCIVDNDCGLPFVDRNIKLYYISTVEGLVLILTCDEVMLTVTCDSNGSWIPDPTDFIQACSPFATVTISQGLNNKTSEDTMTLLLIILIPSTIFSIISLMLFIITLCVVIRMCVAKKTSEDPKQQPVYEEIAQCRKDIPMDENTAYSNIKCSEK